MSNHFFSVGPEQQGKTVAAILRHFLPDKSWSEIRSQIQTRRVRIGADLCLDDARRLKAGDTIELLERPAPKPIQDDGIVLRHVDFHVVVVEKPSGMCTVRHPAERHWPERRKALSPTLEDLVQRKVAREEYDKTSFRLRIVHRLDKETSGLVVFARTVPAERGLGKQFHAHSVKRRYLAVVPGFLPSQRLESVLVRDRGDGRRGSGHGETAGKKAITHVEVLERLGDYTLVACRLETGRTHQIRIHLSEAGHPVCGDPVYHRLRGGKSLPDPSGAPHLALHATELGFEHPVTGEPLHFSMPLPPDLDAWIARFRK